MILSSAPPPASREPGTRLVPAVAGVSRTRTDARPPEPQRRDEGGAPYIDAEFVEVLREAAETAVTVVAADPALRRALEAYRTAEGRLLPVGSVVDVAT